MAVIKQIRQYLPQNIGVVRADTGAGEVARSVSNLADAMIETSFDELKKQARERGIEVAQAASASSLRTIDPITGEPEAFRIPEGFGREAQAAYQSIVENRYISQTEGDFKQKAAELALKYQYDSNGVEKFSTEFADFIDETSKNASPRFSNIIDNVGGALLASTKLNLQAKANERARDAEAGLLLSDIQSTANTLTNLAGNVAYAEGSELFNDVAGIYETNLLRIQQAETARIITGSQAQNYRNTLNESLFAASGQRIISKLRATQGITSVNINDVEIALQSRNLSGIEYLGEDILQEVESLIESPDFPQFQSTVFSAINSFAADFRNKEVLKSQAEAEAENQANRQTRLNLDSDVEKANEEIQRLVNEGNIAGVINVITGLKKSLDDKAEKLGTDVQTNAALKDARLFAQQKLIDIVNSKANLQEMAAFESYIRTGGNFSGDKLTPEVKKLADAVNQMQGLSVDRGFISQQINQYISQKQAIANATNKAQSDINSDAALANGAANPSSASIRKRIDERISSQFGNVPPASLFFSQDGFSKVNEWSSLVAQTKVLPDSIFQGVQNMINSGDTNDPTAFMKLQYYSIFSQLRTPDSIEPVNLFALAGMSNENIGLIEGALSISAFSPAPEADTTATQENFFNALQTLRATVDEPRKYAALEKQILGDESLDNFVLKATKEPGFLFTESDNPVIAERFRSYAKYLIASGSLSKNEIEDKVRATFKQTYHKMAGVVVDPANQHGGYSMHALQGRFGNNLGPVVDMLNAQIKSMGIDDAMFVPDYAFDSTVRDVIKEDAAKISIFAQQRVAQAIEAVESEGGEATLQTGLGRDTQKKKRMYLLPLPYSGTTEEDIRYMAAEMKNGSVVPYLYINPNEIGVAEPQFLYFSLDQMSRDLIQFAAGN